MVRKPPTDNPLLDKALEHKVKAGPAAKTYSTNEVDLMVRWYLGEVETSQVAHALNIKPGHVHTNASRAVKQAIADGHITIVWKAAG